jgi:Flp pilus assembly protein TadD
VQQDLELGEAWANMGAIFMRIRDFPKAHSALEEALKYKTGNWRIIENLMVVSLALGK